MKEEASYGELSQFLNGCIRDIQQRHPNYSDKGLAKKIGLSNSTYNRLKNGDTRLPSFENALKVVRLNCGEEEVQEFIRKHYPQMMNSLKRVYPGNSDVKFVKVEGETYFEDPTTFEIMMMATSVKGVSRDEVKEEFGKKGLTIIDKLTQNQILKEENGRIGINGPINASQSTVHKLLQNLVKLSYDVDVFGQVDNWLSVQYESVNLEVVMPKLREIMVRANNEIRELLNDPKSKGKDVLWAGLVMDSLRNFTESESNSGVIQ